MSESFDQPESAGFYDRQGKPLTQEEWGALIRDPDYRRVAQTVLGDVMVSTVWIGLDHSFGFSGSAPIFETLVIGGPHDDHREHYHTEASALAGHDQAVAMEMDAKSEMSSCAAPGPH